MNRPGTKARIASLLERHQHLVNTMMNTGDERNKLVFQRETEVTQKSKMTCGHTHLSKYADNTLGCARDAQEWYEACQKMCANPWDVGCGDYEDRSRRALALTITIHASFYHMAFFFQTLGFYILVVSVV